MTNTKASAALVTVHMHISTNLYIIFTFHHLLTYWFCKPSYTVSTWIVRNKLELEFELETWNNLRQHAKYFTIITYLLTCCSDRGEWFEQWKWKIDFYGCVWGILPLRAIYYSHPFLNNSKETFIREFWFFFYVTKVCFFQLGSLKANAKGDHLGLGYFKIYILLSPFDFLYLFDRIALLRIRARELFATLRFEFESERKLM